MSAVAGRYGWRGQAGHPRTANTAGCGSYLADEPHTPDNPAPEPEKGCAMNRIITKAVFAAVAAATATGITDRVADGGIDVALAEHAAYGAIAAALVVLHDYATSRLGGPDGR